MTLTRRLRKLFGPGYDDRILPRAEVRLVGADDSTCQVNGRRRDWSMMPIPPPRRHSLMAKAAHQQMQSPLFARLPPEVRRLIYQHLFGKRRVHVEYDVDVPYCEDPRTQEREKRSIWRWWHFICVEGDFYPTWAAESPRDRCSSLELEEGLEGFRKRSEMVLQNWRNYKLSLEWLQCCRLG